MNITKRFCVTIAIFNQSDKRPKENVLNSQVRKSRKGKMTKELQKQRTSQTFIDDANNASANLGKYVQVVAGGTWLMRVPFRSDFSDKVFVSIGKIDALRDITIKSELLTIVAMATHQKIVEWSADVPKLVTLQKSAFAFTNP